MTRKVVKRAVRVGNKVTDAARAEIVRIIAEEPDLTDTEIATRCIGHASAAGRVSEIRRSL